MGEPGVHRFHLRKLNLDAGLVGFGVACKNVENELAPVQDLALDDFFYVANLAGRQLRIDDNRFAAMLLHERADFGKLARTHIRGSYGRLAALNNGFDNGCAGCCAEHAHFLYVNFEQRRVA